MQERRLTPQTILELYFRPNPIQSKIRSRRCISRQRPLPAMPLIFDDCEDADWTVQSFLSEQDLGRLACVSKHFLTHIFAENHDERLWSPLADTFIEWMPDSILPATIITRTFGGYRHLLKYRRTSGPKQGWGHLRDLDKNQTAEWYHPYLKDVDRTLFFTDYYKIQQGDKAKHLMSQAHLGLSDAGWFDHYRGDLYATSRLVSEDCNDWLNDTGGARKDGPYARKCRPLLQDMQGTILVQFSAVDVSRRGQFCREMLIEQYSFPLTHIKTTRTSDCWDYDEDFCVSERTSILSPGGCEDPYMTWNDNNYSGWDDNYYSGQQPSTTAFSSAAWSAYAKTLKCWFSDAERFLQERDYKHAGMGYSPQPSSDEDSANSDEDSAMSEDANIELMELQAELQAALQVQAELQAAQEELQAGRERAEELDAAVQAELQAAQEEFQACRERAEELENNLDRRGGY